MPGLIKEQKPGPPTDLDTKERGKCLKRKGVIAGDVRGSPLSFFPVIYDQLYCCRYVCARFVPAGLQLSGTVTQFIILLENAAFVFH